MSQEPDEILGKELLPLSQANDENSKRPILSSNAEKWEKIHQIFYQGKNYYRVVDVIDALEVSAAPADYWSTMKRRIKEEGEPKRPHGSCRVSPFDIGRGDRYDKAY